MTRAEYPGKKVITHGAPILCDGERRWVEFEDLDPRDDDFAQLGEAFDRAIEVAAGRVGYADSILFPQRDAVDFAVTWMEANRH